MYGTWVGNSESKYITDTFQTFVNTIIPRSPELAFQYGRVQFYGALDLYTDEYLIMSLDSIDSQLALTTAETLNTNPELVRYKYGDIYHNLLSLNRFAMMGYYSEWSGYGSTRLNAPNDRLLEYFPVSWEQIGYPGPSQGYRSCSIYDYATKQDNER